MGEIELLEAQENVTLKESFIEEMKKNESDLKDEINELENKFKKCKMDLDLTNTHAEKFEKQVIQLQELNEDLRGQLHVIKQVEKDSRKSEDRWSYKIVNLNSENALLTNQLKNKEED